MQEEDSGDATKTPAPARLQQPPVQHGAEERALQPSAADRQKGGEPVGKAPRQIDLAAISSAEMPSAKRHRSSRPAVHGDTEVQQGLQQVQESYAAPSSSAVDPQVQQQQLERQNSEEAWQFLEEIFPGCRERAQFQAIPEQVLEAPEHVEQPTEERQQEGQQEGLQLSAPEGEVPQQQELQPKGKRQRSPEREQQPAADEQQPVADDEQPAADDEQPAADHTQAVQQAPASQEGTGASTPRAALSPKRQRKVCFADVEGISEVRGPSSEQGGGASGAQEGAVTEVRPVDSHPAMVSSDNR